MPDKYQLCDQSFPPNRLIIPHDNYHGKYVGITESGDQFFITTPFTFEGSSCDNKEFVACYIFHQDGEIKKAEIEELGSRASIIGQHQAKILPGMTISKNQETEELIRKFLNELGEIAYKDISVAPFEINKFGVQFGLIPFPDDDDDDDDEEEGTVILLPGNYMAFYSPWNGDYDT